MDSKTKLLQHIERIISKLETRKPMSDEDREIYKEALILREQIQKSTKLNWGKFLEFITRFFPDDIDS